jgi:hypothetical protein
MERERDSGKVNSLLEDVEAQRDAWIRDGVWDDISESGGDEEEWRAVVGGIVHYVLICLAGEAWESDLCAQAGEFNHVAEGSSPRQRMMRFLYALRGGAPVFCSCGCYGSWLLYFPCPATGASSCLCRLRS